jgi:hypothetical protein
MEAVFSVCPCRGYITRTSCHYERVLRRQLEELEVGVRWPPAGEDVSPGAKDRPLLEVLPNRAVKTWTKNTIVFA